MKCKITCDYSDLVRDKLLPDLLPMLGARVREEIDLSVQEFNKSPEPGFCHHAQVFDSGYTIDGLPVMVFLKMVVESGTLRTKIACHLGAEKSVQAKQDNYQDCMKEMGATSFKEPFFVSKEQPKKEPKKFVTTQKRLTEIGLEPTEELVARIEARLDAEMEKYYKIHGEYPGEELYRANAARAGLITVAQVISDMGLEPTPELVGEAEEAMIDWFEHMFRDVVPIDDGGLSCYYRYGSTYYFREELSRKKIEEIVRTLVHKEIKIFKLTCDYSDQTREKLLPDLRPVLEARVKKNIKDSVPFFETSPVPLGGCHHTQILGTEHKIDGEPVLIYLSTLVTPVDGGTQADGICHIGSEKNVRAMKAKSRDLMEEWGAFVRLIDHENQSRTND